MTNHKPASDRDFDGALSDAVQQVAESKAAQQEAVERQRPRPRGPILVATTILALIVVTWDVRVMTEPPQGLPDDIVTGDMRFTVGTLAQEVDLYLEQEGRLPSAADLVAEDLIDEDMTYELTADGYAITLVDEELMVRYESRVPLDIWVSTGAGS